MEVDGRQRRLHRRDRLRRGDQAHGDPGSQPGHGLEAGLRIARRGRLGGAHDDVDPGEGLLPGEGPGRPDAGCGRGRSRPPPKAGSGADGRGGRSLPPLQRVPGVAPRNREGRHAGFAKDRDGGPGSGRNVQRHRTGFGRHVRGIDEGLVEGGPRLGCDGRGLELGERRQPIRVDLGRRHRGDERVPGRGRPHRSAGTPLRGPGQGKDGRGPKGHGSAGPGRGRRGRDPGGRGADRRADQAACAQRDHRSRQGGGRGEGVRRGRRRSQGLGPANRQGHRRNPGEDRDDPGGREGIERGVRRSRGRDRRSPPAFAGGGQRRGGAVGDHRRNRQDREPGGNQEVGSIANSVKRASDDLKGSATDLDHMDQGSHRLKAGLDRVDAVVQDLAKLATTLDATVGRFRT